MSVFIVFSGPGNHSDKDVLTALAGILASALTMLGATVAIVSFSGTRQEHLSSRIRLLCGEYRALKEKDRARRQNIAAQLYLFKRRLRSCVCGHICLYVALATEITIFWLALLVTMLVFTVKMIGEKYLAVAVPVSLVLLIPLVLVLSSVILNIQEYSASNQTMGLELKDIPGSTHEPHSLRDPIANWKILKAATLGFRYFDWWRAKDTPVENTQQTSGWPLDD